MADDAKVCREAIKQMVARFREFEAHSIKPRNFRLFPIAYGWAAQIHRFAEAVLVLVDAGFEHGARVLVRSILEYTITLQWLVEVGDRGADAVMRQHQRSLKVVHKSADEAITSALPTDAVHAVLSHEVPKVDEEEALRRFEAICKELAVEKNLYVVYRVESSVAHPTLASATEYLVGRDDTGIPALRDTPSGGLAVIPLTANCLVWAGRALDTLLLDRPLRTELQAVAKTIGTARTLPHRSPARRRPRKEVMPCSSPRRGLIWALAAGAMP